jgi:hypothetical protein
MFPVSTPGYGMSGPRGDSWEELLLLTAYFVILGYTLKIAQDFGYRYTLPVFALGALPWAYTGFFNLIVPFLIYYVILRKLGVRTQSPTGSRITFNLILLVVALVLLFVGLRPLISSYSFTTSLEKKIAQTQSTLMYNTGCISFSGALWLENWDKLREELAEQEGFLGLYLYPDLDILSRIDTATASYQALNEFIPYEYNAGLEALQMLELTQGEMFVFREYLPDEALPVVVSENSPYQVGDKITLVRDQGSIRGTYYEFSSKEAVVVGIARDNLAVPFVIKSYGSEFYRDTEKAFILYLPEGHGLRRHQPENDQKVSAYTLFSTWEQRDAGIEIVSRYGVWDDMELVMGALNGTEELDYLLRRNVYLQSAVCFALIGAALLVLIALNLRRVCPQSSGHSSP